MSCTSAATTALPASAGWGGLQGQPASRRGRGRVGRGWSVGDRCRAICRGLSDDDGVARSAAVRRGLPRRSRAPWRASILTLLVKCVVGGVRMCVKATRLATGTLHSPGRERLRWGENRAHVGSIMAAADPAAAAQGGDRCRSGASGSHRPAPRRVARSSSASPLATAPPSLERGLSREPVGPHVAACV